MASIKSKHINSISEYDDIYEDMLPLLKQEEMIREQVIKT